jgi:hypothetical protein
VSVTGESGKGKSHTFTTMLKQVPERFRISGAMSNKALFYMEGLQPGMAIVLDDTSLSEDMSEILKGVTTGFQKPFLYRTVNKDRKGQVCVIPERCTWWVAKVEGSGDDQVFNRMLTCWIDDSPEQDNRVLSRVLEQSQAFPQGADERPQVLVCRAMWELIGAERFHVVIPFAGKIKFQANNNRRNPEMLLDLIKSNAVIRFQQREQVEAGGVPCIMATREDFDDAVKLYGLLNGTTGGQATKMTKMESDLVVTIQREGWPEFTISMLQKATGLSNGSVHKLLHGYASRGATYSGLLEKCPFISYSDRTVVCEEEFSRVSMRRRTNAYTFDKELFHSWSSGGGVWLDDNGANGNSQTAHTSADFCTSAAVAEVFGDDSACSDSPIETCTTHLDVSNKQYFCNSESMGPHVEAQDETHYSLYDSAVAEVSDPKSCKQTPTTKPDSSEFGIPLLQLPRNAEIAEVCRSIKISLLDFKPIGYLETHTTCAACGRKGTNYIEKITPARKSRKEELAVRICKKCFEMATRKEQNKAPPLPGIIILSRMVRISKDIGRCSVCNRGKAVYHDREAGIRLCQQCYDREARAPCPVKGGAGG